MAIQRELVAGVMIATCSILHQHQRIPLTNSTSPQCPTINYSTILPRICPCSSGSCSSHACMPSFILKIYIIPCILEHRNSTVQAYFPKTSIYLNHHCDGMQAGSYLCRVPRGGIEWSILDPSGRVKGPTIQPDSHRFNTMWGKSKYSVEKLKKKFFWKRILGTKSAETLNLK